MMTIRKALASDADLVMEMAKQFDRSFRFYESDFRASYDAVLSRKDMFLALAVEEFDVLGYLLGSMCPAFHAKVARIEEVGADPFAFWDHIDPIPPLVAAFEEWAKENNCRVVKKCTSFPPSKSYESLGYEMTGFYYRKRL